MGTYEARGVYWSLEEMEIWFKRPIWYSANRLNTTTAPARHRTPLPIGMILGIYNNWECRAFGLLGTIQAVQKGELQYNAIGRDKYSWWRVLL